MNLVKKAYKFRLYPTTKQVECFQWMLERCRELYNAALEERRYAYQRIKRDAGYYDLETRQALTRAYAATFTKQSEQLPGLKEERPEYQEIYSQVLQDVLRRVDAAFDRFFERVKEGKLPGYPRYKSDASYHSFTYPQSGFGPSDDLLLRLSLSKIGAIKVKWQRLPEGRIKTCTIKREGTHWNVIFTCEVERALVYHPTEEVVGLDMGLRHFATLDDGRTIENPRYYRRAESLLQAAQQVLSRKKRGSARRRKQARLVSKHHRRIRNQRRDFHHKEARKLVNGHQIIVFEKLQAKNMSRRPKPKPAQTPGEYLPNGACAKSGLNKSILDAGWGQFQQLCVSKAEWAGSRVLFVDPQNTSQRCSRCRTIVPKDLDERWHSCPQCGLELDRDQNSALDIKRLGLLLLAQEHQARTVPSGDAPLRSPWL